MSSAVVDVSPRHYALASARTYPFPVAAMCVRIAAAHRLPFYPPAIDFFYRHHVPITDPSSPVMGHDRAHLPLAAVRCHSISGRHHVPNHVSLAVVPWT